jgi:hypothetical protein
MLIITHIMIKLEIIYKVIILQQNIIYKHLQKVEEQLKKRNHILAKKYLIEKMINEYQNNQNNQNNQNRKMIKNSNNI